LSAVTAIASAPNRGVTVLLDFRGEASSQAVEALQEELTKLMRPAGVEFGYRIGSELGPGADPTDIVVVRFHGKCRRDSLSPVLDERGPFAFTHVSNGEILPFAEVACDRVQSSIRSAQKRSLNDKLLGRALARVVAHEMYHIIAKTPHHSREGVARRGLSSGDLVADAIEFNEEGLRRLTMR
jgi:hypothetical protein